MEIYCIVLYTRCTKHYVHLSNIALHPPFQNSLNSSRHGFYKVSKALTQCFPQLWQVEWMSFGWWTILDTHGKLLSVNNPAAWQFLTQMGAPGTYYHTPFKGTYICLAHSPSEWHTNTIHVSIVSRLKNPTLTCLLPFIYTDLSGFNK